MDCVVQGIGQDDADIDVPQAAGIGQEQGTAHTRGDVFVLHVLLIIPRHPEGISRQMDG